MVKTPQEIDALKRGGVLLSSILREIRAACVPGVSTAVLDQMARDRMREVGGVPSFLGYEIDRDVMPFPGALCVSINDEVVHGLPIPARVIRQGDVVGLDIGMWYEGLATDMATTVIAGGTDDQRVIELVKDTRQGLLLGLSAVKAGAWISDVGAAIEDYLKPKRYGIVKDLVGHGVGHAVHEDPQVPNYREPLAPKLKMESGMVLAIEPMVTLGSWKVRLKDDGWTVVTADRSLSAHFELTIVVTDGGYDLITPWPDQS